MVRKLLIVEDDFVIQMFIENLLVEAGFDVVDCVSNGDDAIQAISDYNPDLVLLDVGLAGNKTGVETAAIINKTSKKPFIFITGNSDKGTLKKVKATNPIDILFKPIDERSFVCQILELTESLT